MKIRIEIKFDFEGCNIANKEMSGIARKIRDGVFEIDVNDNLSLDIDACEQAMLQVSFFSMRDAIQHHLERESKRTTIENGKKQVENGHLLEHCSRYRIDSEIGRIEFQTYDYVDESGKLILQSRDLFPAQGSKEYYLTKGFKLDGMFNGTAKQTFRPVVSRMNRQRRQEEDGTRLTTLWDQSEKEGQQVVEYCEKRTDEILAHAGFTEKGPCALGEINEDIKLETWIIVDAEVNQAIKEAEIPKDLHKEVKSNPISYEKADKTVEISIDSVLTKKQKSHRLIKANMSSGSEKVKEKPKGEEKKRVNNRVGYIEHKGQKYTLIGRSYINLLRFVLAFLINNKLNKLQLCFYVDGEVSIRNTISELFSWHPRVKLIMDWYHLVKKCSELLSSAIKGREKRNEHLEKLSYYLWYGCVTAAIKYLKAIPTTHQKDSEALSKLLKYLTNNKQSIPCYALRKHFGLCNSSNRVENANNQLVSQRQKHNGMAWSENGSLALAALNVVKRNYHHQEWLDNRIIPFSFHQNFTTTNVVNF